MSWSVEISLLEILFYYYIAFYLNVYLRSSVSFSSTLEKLLSIFLSESFNFMDLIRSAGSPYYRNDDYKSGLSLWLTKLSLLICCFWSNSWSWSDAYNTSGRVNFLCVVSRGVLFLSSSMDVLCSNRIWSFSALSSCIMLNFFNNFRLFLVLVSVPMMALVFYIISSRLFSSRATSWMSSRATSWIAGLSSTNSSFLMNWNT